ncbi:MAG TPA: R3H domain-containing nucleic acid-binding protein [Vulgatibacter sp.]|nr:R3H domain-containing nucleic acid-binding protein [Vulgatibacter sp.]
MNEEREPEGAPEKGPATEPGMVDAGAPAESLLRAREVIAEIFARLGAKVDVEVRDAAEAIHCTLRVHSGAEVLDAAPRGQVLEAVQYLAGRIVFREGEGRKRIVLHREGEPTREDDPAMGKMALRLADSVRRIGKSLTVVPMNARDRKAIHVALEGVTDIRTRSEGEGNLRRLVVEAVPPAPPEPAGE